MANNNRCGCGRRNSNNYGCLGCLGGRWENYPYYVGPCPNADGEYCCDDVKNPCDDDCRCRRSCRRECANCGIFSAMLPIAVATNGIIPLVNNGCLTSPGAFPVNCGLITVEEKGTYLATYTVRVPEGSTVESTFSLNVNDACQSSSIVQTGGAGPACYTGQALFDVGDQATVTLRSSDAINITETSPQPLVTLSMVKI